MEKKQLGSTGVMLPEIGMGFWRYQGGVEPIRKGIELGATLIDTAEEYKTEEIVGQAIRDCREQIFVATKVSGRNLRHDDVLKAAEASLERLGVSQIDLYQIHWPNPGIPIKPTIRAMETLADRGLIKYIGVSQFSLADLRIALGLMRNHPIVSDQVRYNLNARKFEAGLLPFCERNQISLIAYTPLDDGRLAKPTPDAKGGMSTLQAIAKETGHTIGQVALNWCTSHPAVIAIPKSNSVERTAENCLASGWRLSGSQRERLDRAFSWKYERLRASAGKAWRAVVRGRVTTLNLSDA